MDTSTVTVRADTLGRRVVSRHFRSLEEKLRIIAEAQVSGASDARKTAPDKLRTILRQSVKLL